MTDATFTLVCEDCGHFEDHPNPDDDREVLVGYKENECTHLANAEVLKRIHKVKCPSHQPYIRTEVEVDGEVETFIPDEQFRRAQFREGALVRGGPE